MLLIYGRTSVRKSLLILEQKALKKNSLFSMVLPTKGVPILTAAH